MSSIVHSVYFKYKAEVSTEQKLEVLQQFRALDQRCVLSEADGGRAYIVKAQFGTENVSPEGQGKGFEFAAHLTFENTDHLLYYVEKDPAHNEFKKFVGPLLADVFIFDFNPSE